MIKKSEPVTPNDLYLETLKSLTARLRTDTDPLRRKMIERECGLISGKIFDNLLTDAAEMGVKELSINPQEIISTEYNYDACPKTIWDLADRQGIGYGCMDVHQSLIHSYVFPTPEYIGKWDTTTKTKIGAPDRLVWGGFNNA